MYQRILVPVEHSAADRTILDHIVRLIGLTRATLLLVHVADGWAARHFDELQLRESEEMRDDRAYLEQLVAELREKGVEADWKLAMGDPASEIIRMAAQERVDLIAMATHGHRFVMDLLLGTTVDTVRHHVQVPVLLLKVPNDDPTS
jgi:nucleotide-binding universal stress UspA family protein